MIPCGQHKSRGDRMKILLLGDKNEYERRKRYFEGDEIIGFISSSEQDKANVNVKSKGFDYIVILPGNQGTFKLGSKKKLSFDEYMDKKYSNSISIYYNHSYCGTTERYVFVVAERLDDAFITDAVLRLASVLEEKALKTMLYCTRDGKYREKLVENNIVVVVGNGDLGEKTWERMSAEKAEAIVTICRKYTLEIERLTEINKTFWWVPEVVQLSDDICRETDLHLVLMQNNKMIAQKYHADILVPYVND